MGQDEPGQQAKPSDQQAKVLTARRPGQRAYKVHGAGHLACVQGITLSVHASNGNTQSIACRGMRTGPQLGAASVPYCSFQRAVQLEYLHLSSTARGMASCRVPRIIVNVRGRAVVQQGGHHDGSRCERCSFRRTRPKLSVASEP